MPNRVQLEIVDGKMKGRTFEFAEHDTFIFGRSPDCHAHLPDDTLVSRHHFILEVSPPLARLRDLGSRTATHVNNRKCGGRNKGETPEQGAKRKYPEVDLNHGDRIRREEQTGNRAVFCNVLRKGDVRAAPTFDRGYLELTVHTALATFIALVLSNVAKSIVLPEYLPLRISRHNQAFIHHAR